ncbi:MAG: hypothetical protein H6704_01125 [Myxococcales bacterium]|nr:hypothetical protein [Myxococcales bacterium]MCB9534845.1 hypothetical protein [Myxococcales bacterium]
MHRSTHPIEAAGLYLDAVASRGAHDALALADADGLLLAGTSRGPDVEALAAIAPLAAEAPPPPHDGLLGLVTRGAALQVWPLDVGPSSCYLAAVGGAARPAGLEADLNRILG